MLGWRNATGGLTGSCVSCPPSVRNSRLTSSIVLAIGPIAPSTLNGPTHGGRCPRLVHRDDRRPVARDALARAKRLREGGAERREDVLDGVVLVDVEVTDSSGRPVKGLKASDFTVLEDGKPQKISSFVYADVEGFARAGADAGKPVVVPVAGSPSKSELGSMVRDRRLILLFFDLTSLHTDDLLRAREAAIHFVKAQMSPADLVGAVTLGNRLGLLANFTNDKQTLLAALDRAQLEADARTLESTVAGLTDQVQRAAGTERDATLAQLASAERRLAVTVAKLEALAESAGH